MNTEQKVAVITGASQGSGHIVQISTSLVDNPIAGVPSVLASLTKGGLNAATKTETEKDGPLVQNISSELLAPTAFSSVK